MIKNQGQLAQLETRSKKTHICRNLKRREFDPPWNRDIVVCEMMMPVLIDPNMITKMQLLEVYRIWNLILMFDWYHGVVMVAHLVPNRLPNLFF